MTARALWALDGARISFDRAEMLDGAGPGRVELVVPSFLVEHDDGLLLMDSGLAPDAADDPGTAYGDLGDLARQIDFGPDRRVDAQLRAAGVAPEDVTHVVLSHVHFDHTGGLRLFPRARFLLGAGDRDAVERPERDELAREVDLDPVRAADWTFLDGDHDVFGDGSVVVLAMPGHTPGNTSLLVRLPDRALILTGDTAHLRGALTTHRPMSADTDRDAAVGSLRRLDALATELGAQVWVTHDPHDWERFGGAGLVAGVWSSGA